MIKRLLLPICFISISSYGHHQMFVETKAMQPIGEALVRVSYDRFYDTYFWVLSCYDRSSTEMPPMGVSVTCEENSKIGVSFVLSEATEVASTDVRLRYQFDDDEPISVKAKFSNPNSRHAIVEFDKDELSAFLEGMATSDAIMFSIGTVKDTIDLTEMRTAVDEYRNMLAEAYVVEFKSNTENHSPAELDKLPHDGTEVESSSESDD